ncbi:MAG: EAL domain-containing protein [Gammaproteobacteria bacterium]|nr:EAL domain-containing protein [Gammaproteobacteria bacterium]
MTKQAASLAHSLASAIDPKLSGSTIHRLATGAPPGTRPMSTARPGDDASDGNTARVRVLIVDDDDVDRERIRRYFRKAELDYDVTETQSGAEALALTDQDRFDLILLDYRLGDMTGLDLLAALQQRGGHDTPVIMITGGGNEILAVEAMQHGVADYIPKQALNADTLRLATNNALRVGEAQRQLRAAQERLLRLSMYDELTGLPNRWLFLDRLDQFIARAERQDARFSLLLIDLNRFKHVNDYYGHAKGDEVLAAVGDRLKQVARKSDTVARLGGDEFACILADTFTDSEIDTCVMKMHDCICQPIPISGAVVRIGASIGIARSGVDGKDRDTLLAHADSAMYEAKSSHRRFALFSNAPGREQVAKPGCQDLCEGMRHDEFFLQFQPQVSLATGQVTGLEALIRWQSPRFGEVRPDDFIPVAESSGLIKELTCSVLLMGLEQVAEWRAIGLRHPVSFNISARLLDENDWVEWLAREMKRLDITPNDLILEITETAIASSNTQQRRHLHALSERGFKLSIDDFGTGFTSFKSIREWRPSELKIDRLFVHDVKDGSSDASIIESIVTLAKSLGVRLVAEGIETADERDFLTRSGCEYGQGFAIAHPMSISDVTQWLVDHEAASTAKH